MPKSSNSLSVCMITTGFPVIAGDTSGIFIKKLVDQFGGEIKLKILVPSHKNEFSVFTNYEVIRVKYFFRKCENLFYSARGLPQEIKRNPFILWQLPFFIISMIYQSLKHSRDVDVIHAQWLPTGIFGVLPKIIWGKPLVVSIRGSDMKRMNSNRIDKLLAKIVFKFCNSAVVISKSFMAQLNIQFPSVKIVYIPNGIDRTMGSNISIKTKNELFEFLYVGNLVLEKGILDLKWAFEKLILTEYKVKLTLIGNGDLKEMLGKWSNEHPDRIDVKGIVPHDEVMDSMRKSDVLVLPSYSEGRPNVVIEAMANFLPVMGTNLDGIMELITNEESGLLFCPGDKNKLFELMKNCVDGNIPLNKYAEKAYGWIENESLTWQESAMAHVNLYKLILIS